jgi:uncharacterized protein (TIRG00374 family)
VKPLLRILLSAAAAAALLALLAWWGNVGPGELAAVVRQLPAQTYLLALGVHASVYVARAARFQALIPPASRPSFASMLAASSAHNLAAYVLPAKTGEAALVVYLKAGGVPMRAGLASLLVSRVLDLATLSGALACATAWLALGEHWHAPLWTGLTMAAAFALAAFFFFALSARGDRLVAAGQGLARLVRVDRTRFGRRLVERSGELGEALRDAGAGGRLRAAIPVSLAIWGGIFVFYAILAQGFGLPPRIGILEAAFGSSLAVLTNLLPINALAGFGTQETGWVVGFGLLGVPRDLSFATGFGVHVVQLANVCVLGLVGHLAMGILPLPRPRKAG